MIELQRRLATEPLRRLVASSTSSDNGGLSCLPPTRRPPPPPSVSPPFATSSTRSRSAPTPSSDLLRLRPPLRRLHPATSFASQARCLQIHEAMAKEVSRASWNFTYEKGLVDTLHDHNNPKFRGQNGWVTEGWRSIVEKFNQKFPLAHFTKQQIQEKEKELKGNYKSIKDARKQSGTGWDDSLGMIIAKPKIWDKIVADYPKVKKFRSKPFPLFNTLALLYEGSIAKGDLNFVSVPQAESTTNQVPLVENEIPYGGSNPFSSTTLDGQGATSTNLEAEDFKPTTSACSEQKGEDTGKKRKPSQIAGALENYLDFKKKQTQKLVEEMKEASKLEDKFSIEKCVDTLEAIEELTDVEKAKALKLFKCSLNRELFMNTKSTSVRLLWLKDEIYS